MVVIIIICVFKESRIPYLPCDSGGEFIPQCFIAIGDILGIDRVRQISCCTSEVICFTLFDATVYQSHIIRLAEVVKLRWARTYRI